MRFKMEASFREDVFSCLESITSLISEKLLYSFLLTMLGFAANGQILDDSTKQVYGAKTTSYVLEEDFLYNRYKRINTDTSWSIMGAPYTIDTTLNDLHNYTFLYKNKNIYQDLGNIGTPVQSIYFQPPKQIGKTLGFNVVDAYAIDPQKIRYMDTKSPYTNLTYVQSSKGQQVLEAEHSRNIKPNWNAGFIFRRQTAQKIEGSSFGTASGKKPLVSHYSFAFYTRFHTKNERYQILFNFTHLHHTNYDIGGVVKKKNYIPSTLYNEAYDTLLYDKEEVNLYAARSIDKRENFHLYHEYSLNRTKTIQLYHIADFNKRLNRYNELTSQTASVNARDFLYYKKNTFGKDALMDTTKIFLFSDAVMDDRTEYKLLENRIGLKGNIKNLSYNVYMRSKDMYSYIQPSYRRDTIIKSVGYNLVGDTEVVNRKYIENFIGGNVGYFLKDSSFFKAEAEYLFQGKTTGLARTMHDYRLNLEYYYKYLQFGYSVYTYSPSLVQQFYRTNLAVWDHVDSNSFKQTTSQRLFAGLTLKTPYFTLSPKVTHDRISNYIYYNTIALPEQTSRQIQYTSAELFVKVKVSIFHLELFGKYTFSSGTPVLDMVPKYFNHNRFFMQSYLFKRATLLQLGVDTYWKSTYNANKYMPVTQQFYLNNLDFPIKSYLLMDVFLNAQIRSFRIFVRVSHVNQGNKKGYYITPYYPGLPRSVEFGLNWRFYN